MSIRPWKNVVVGTQRMPFGMRVGRVSGGPNQSGARRKISGPNSATPSLEWVIITYRIGARASAGSDCHSSMLSNTPTSRRSMSGAVSWSTCSFHLLMYGVPIQIA